MRFRFPIRNSPVDSVGSPDPPRQKKSAPQLYRDRLIWSVALGLLVLVLSLIPLYLLASPRLQPQRTLSYPKPAATRASVLPTPAPTSAAGETVAGPTPRAVQTPVAIPTSAASDDRFAVLLLGYGGGNHDGADLTDSIMMVIVDPTRKTMTLLSVPRDSWVPLLFDGVTPVYNKVNTAYAFALDPSLYPDRLEKYTGPNGAGVFASDTISRLLGVPISYYVSLDFEGFREIIDAVGGIDLDVPTGFAARYPINDDPSINAGWTIVRFQAGEQHMNGERAIEYARAREVIDNSGEGSDFARSRRQRLIIEAFKQRLFQPGGLVHVPQVLAIASQHVDTNYAIPAVAKISQMLVDWKDVRFYQTALTTDNYLEVGTGTDGTYLLVPNSTDHSWAQVRAFVRRLWDDPTLGVGMAATTVVVENDSGLVGLGTRVSLDLARLGYVVGRPVTGSLRSVSDIVDRTDGHADPVISQLQKDLGLPDLALADPNDRNVSTNSGDSREIILELGTDSANLRLTVPSDAQAPSSAVGVATFGDWSPDFGVPTPAQATPTPQVTPTATPREQTGTIAVPSLQATPILVVGNPNMVVVPNLIGLPEAQAQRVINQSDLMTTYVNYQTIDQVPDRKYFLSTPPGAVLSQHPLPGTKVPRGTRIELAVRKP